MKNFFNIQWRLVFYDAVVFVLIAVFLFAFPTGNLGLDSQDMLIQGSVAFLIFFIVRFICRVYQRIWRFEGVSGYLALITTDLISLIINLIVQAFLPVAPNRAFFFVVLFLLNLLAGLTMRMAYRYIFKTGISGTKTGKFYSVILKIFAGNRVKLQAEDPVKKINIAIAGAGRTGTALMEEIIMNPASHYNVQFFIDADNNKVGKRIEGVKVLPEDDNIYEELKQARVKEVVIAMPDMGDTKRVKLFEFYKKSDCKVKVYDFPTTNNANSKRQMREFDIEDLMPRKQIILENPELNNFYKNKVVLITGGGGSIGSEIARQIAAMKPKRLVLIDIYENGVYDLQQELKQAYGKNLSLDVVIVSVTDKPSLERVFKDFKPEIVIHAAAHKHVPLMENNCIEAITNNIFGTKNVIDLSEDNNVYKFMMVSTDKAVNPTNVMGATKRFCEMMVQCANNHGKVRYGATRFGNVLGSAGSVVPLFRRQISNGGPVTITDKRIIRYFMTIPEACNLVLQSSVMANNGELFVLDMGHPVRILDLAQNMIDISGIPNIEIVETGLRPGEKLFEELLIDYKVHKKTDNDLIFVEKDVKPLPAATIARYIKQFEEAIVSGDDNKAREALKDAVSEFKNPEEVNYAFISTHEEK